MYVVDIKQVLTAVCLKAIFRDFWVTQTHRVSIDTNLKSLCSKFQLAMILHWQNMQDNMNHTSPLNSVL